MNLPRRATALALCAALASGCAVVPPGSAPTPSPSPTPSAGPSAGPSVAPTASPSASPAALLDLTRPGAARDLVDDLMDAAGASRAILVTVTATDAAVTVLADGTAEQWAWRAGQIQQVPTDVTYVAQRTFDPDDYALDDLGALFRTAGSVAGSASGQSLQIVDYAAGQVAMSVSTVPESRAVFFLPDGTLLPTLDFTSLWGLEQGYADAVGGLRSTSSVGFGSALGVQVDTPHTASGSYERRHRTARTPVIVTPRSEAVPLASFDPALADPAVVWGVLEELNDDGAFSLDTPWTCIVDDRADRGTPRMYFDVGERSFVTNLQGRILTR
ncbi:MAG: hypothetical protein Q4F65_02450 [Propionibacteriaceae bacterium]|nr:hypothetical protein [Propionibacteriaceae bacterium]